MRINIMINRKSDGHNYGITHFDIDNVTQTP